MRIDHPKNSDINQLKSLWKSAFYDVDSFIDSFFHSAFSEKRCRCVYEADKIVASLYWFRCQWNGKKVAYLYAVATDEKYRGRGLCTHLMNDTHAYLKNEDYHGVILVPGEQSLFSFYEKMGYRSFSSVGTLSATASDQKISLREISLDEYSKLRKSYLPDQSVIQEGENLSFLSEISRLYCGEDFLLSARIEGRKLIGLELLGNEAAAGSIVKTLNCDIGEFRVPDGNTSFAMYFSLNHADSNHPKYFGLAFNL